MPLQLMTEHCRVHIQLYRLVDHPLLRSLWASRLQGNLSGPWTTVSSLLVISQKLFFKRTRVISEDCMVSSWNSKCMQWFSFTKAPYSLPICHRCFSNHWVNWVLHLSDRAAHIASWTCGKPSLALSHTQNCHSFISLQTWVHMAFKIQRGITSLSL